MNLIIIGTLFYISTYMYTYSISFLLIKIVKYKKAASYAVIIHSVGMREQQRIEPSDSQKYPQQNLQGNEISNVSLKLQVWFYMRTDYSVSLKSRTSRFVIKYAKNRKNKTETKFKKR